MPFLGAAAAAGRMSLDAPRGTDRVVRRLVEILGTDPADLPRVDALTPAAPAKRTIAVDGSSVTLAEAGDRTLAAFRAGRIGVERGAALPPRNPPAEVVLLWAQDAQATVAERLDAAGFPGQALPRLDRAAALDALRTIAEMEQALEALEELDAGDLLLLDGALQARALVPLIDRVLARAAERGVDVVGVCKSTSMTIGGAPALVACQMAARGKHATWMAPLPPKPQVRGRSYAARLSPAEPRPFRFDVASTREPRDVLASIAALCGHPAYPGYPSPLAMAHNAVLINDEARRRLLALVQEAVLKAGVEADAWEAAFVDYHDVLELGA